VILVTGATGFLGGSLVRALTARGDRVRALVREGSSPAATAELEGLGVACAEGDVLAPESLVEAMKGVGALIHCAGKLGRAGATDREYQRIHVDGTVHVLDAARAAGVARVMHVSSPGILGPIRGADATEDAPYNPTNVYERAKAASERAVLARERAHGAQAVIVRPEFVYGPHDLHVFRLVRSIQRGRFFYIGRGDAICHPTFVDDAVSGMLAAFDRAPLGRTFHIAGPRPVTIRELVESFALALGVTPPRLHVPEVAVRLGLRGLRPIAKQLLRRDLPIDESGVDFFTMDRHFSCQRAKDELGWTPQVDVAEGAREAVAWYKQRGLL
jgi:nucleoside-diphosphate-sugar epimerase